MTYSNDATCHAEDAIPSAAKVKAWHLLNEECLVAERNLFCVVDAVACLLAHGGPDGGGHTRGLARNWCVIRSAGREPRIASQAR